MLDRLISYVAALSPEAVNSLLLQDIALALAWVESLGKTSEEQERLQAIRTQTERWWAAPQPPEIQTEGRRHQWLIRELVDALRAGRMEALQRDEIHFLCVMHRFIKQSSQGRVSERLSGLLAPYMPAVEARRPMAIAAPGLPTLSARLEVVTPEDIRAAKPREIRILAGIELPCMGPVYSRAGHLRIIGSVPENCTVVLEEGHCCVDGYVLGRVAARDHCEVRENVSGVVIVRQGNVRARNIIDNAFVVSKRGRVYCKACQGPKLVFAGSEIRMAGGAVLGSYAAPGIHIGNDALGGEYDVSGTLTASRFRHSKSRPLAIVLRSNLSCEDYGEATSPEMNRWLSKANRLRVRLQNLKHMAHLAEQDAEHCATTVLMYLLAGDNVRKQVQDLTTAQRRLAVLNRIVAGLVTLTHNAEQKLRGPSPQADAPKTSEETEPTMDFDEVEADIQAITAEDLLIDGDLAEERAGMVEMREKLAGTERDRRSTTVILARLRERLSARLREREQLGADIRQKEQHLQTSIGYADLLERSGKATKVQLLKGLLAKTRGPAADSTLVARTKSKFAHWALRTMGQRLKAAEKHRSAAQKVREELAEVGDALWKRFQIQLGEEEPGAKRAARVTGRFDAGVRIYTDRYVMQEAQPARGALLIAPDSGGRVVTYMRGMEGIIEAPPAAE